MISEAQHERMAAEGGDRLRLCKELFQEEVEQRRAGQVAVPPAGALQKRHPPAAMDSYRPHFYSIGQPGLPLQGALVLSYVEKKGNPTDEFVYGNRDHMIYPLRRSIHCEAKAST